MGNRLSKIYTRTGDKGTTGLGDGSRIEKDHPRVAVLGDVDELNSLIGLICSGEIPDNIRALLSDIQNDLLDLGAELSVPGKETMTTKYTEHLEKVLDDLNQQLQPLKEFVLPGGSPGSALCHLARTVCRRAERNLVSLSRKHDVSASALAYLNRLSDLLFVVSRHLNRAQGGKEVLWEPGKNA